MAEGTNNRLLDKPLRLADLRAYSAESNPSDRKGVSGHDTDWQRRLSDRMNARD